MKIKKMILGLLLGIGLVIAQPMDQSGYADTTLFTSFKADSLKYGKAFIMSDFENKIWLFLANDTNAAGFASDSAKFRVGYQRGFTCLNASGYVDTSWRNICWMDTFNMAARIITSATTTEQDATSFQENFTMGQIDTSYVTGYGVLSVPMVALWSPIVRPVIKGLPGDKVGGWVKVVAQLSQRAYQAVRLK